MFGEFVYTVAACLGTFAEDFDKNINLPGNNSWIVTSKCELRYDKYIKWAEGYVQTTLHLENTVCKNGYCKTEYKNDVNLKMRISMSKCLVDNVFFDMENFGTISDEWVAVKVWPVFKHKIQEEFQDNINNAAQLSSGFQTSCY